MKKVLLIYILMTQSALAEYIGRPASCLFVIKGVEIIKGECLFKPISNDGSFTIHSYNGKFFAYLLVDNGIADASWNEVPYASHAHTYLGKLVREKGCWASDLVSVCAY